MKVVITGLIDYINYGDQFIARCVEYLVQQVKSDVELVELSFIYHTDSLPHKIMYKAFKYCQNKHDYPKAYKLLRTMNKTAYENAIKDADAIIFAGGSFKYGTQLIWAYYSIIVELANKYGIPVMFDAMNVQNYKDDDWRCVCLKQHLNYPSVKMFTSRDGMAGVNRINQSYKTNSELLVFPAGDPAYWIKECYGINKDNESKKIGINLIQTKNFVNYGGSLSNDDVMIIYERLITELVNNNYEYELFTNGLQGDYKMGLELKERLNEKGIRLLDIRVPQNDRDLVEIISQYKIIVGARLHACICAYSLDIPVVGIVWDEKLLHFSEMAKIENSFFDEKSLSGYTLYESVIKNMEREYDQVTKEKWKNATKETIKEFLQMSEKNA